MLYRLLGLEWGWLGCFPYGFAGNGVLGFRVKLRFWLITASFLGVVGFVYIFGSYSGLRRLVWFDL